jgi:pyruvyl transferase EpsO
MDSADVSHAASLRSSGRQTAWAEPSSPIFQDHDSGSDHESHSALILRLQVAIDDALSDLVPTSDFALLDFPNYANVGDSAIWRGEVAYLRGYGRTPKVIGECGSLALAALDRRLPEGPILLSGGGNFGDLWPRHQAFREKILERYAGRPVIQLPQSIHYDDVSRIEVTQRAIAKHRAFTLLVRDTRSFDFARSHFDCEVRLAPDMAFCLGQIPRPAPSGVEHLMLLRTDKEAINLTARQDVQAEDSLVIDWLDEPKWMTQAASLRAVPNAVLGLARGEGPRTAARQAYRQSISVLRLERGLRLLSKGRTVTTDRLHGHILCTLLGIPHVVIDNSYGKLSAFMDTWRTRWSGVTTAEA